MGILDTKTPPRLAANRLVNGSQSLFGFLVSQFGQMFAKVWENPSATPEEIFAELGPNAGQLVQYAGMLQAFVNSIKPGTLTQSPPQAITVNPDGTVVIAPISPPAQDGGA
jgi:hypothetical protein